MKIIRTMKNKSSNAMWVLGNDKLIAIIVISSDKQKIQVLNGSK